MFNLVLFSWNRETQQFDFSLPLEPPMGYKSGVCQMNEKIWICCGTSGIDYTQDGGHTWKHFSDEAFHTVQRLNEKSVILVGPKGKIASFILD